MKYFLFILFFTLNVFSATKSLQGDLWLSNDLTKTYTPPSISDTLVGLTASQTITGKIINGGTVSATTISNPVFLDEILGNFSTTKHGLVPKGTNVGSFLKDDGTWSSISIASGTTITSPVISGGSVSDTSVTVLDTHLTVVDNSVPSKKLRFELNGITSNTTRTFTAPDDNGTLVCASCTQTLDNKSMTDSTFSIIDNAVTTKIAKFEIGNLSVGQTRLYTMPNASGTIVLTDDTGALQNKTISSSTIGGSVTVSGTGNIIYQSDADFTLFDQVTPTKKLQFELSSIGANQTRFMTIPNASFTVVGEDTTQTLTNKTVSTSTIIVNDDVLTIQDNTTPTKKVQFQVSGLTAATTRTATFPDSNITFAATDFAQTWTAIPNLNAGYTASGTITVNANEIFATGKGIDLDANTASPSTVSSTTATYVMTNYASGTWTPSFVGSTSSPSTITYTTQVGTFEKRGPRVCYEFTLLISAITGGSGNVYVSGTPYVVSSAAHKGGGAVTSKGGWTTNGPDMIDPIANTHALQLVFDNNTTIAATTVNGNMSATTAVNGQGCYITTE